MQKSVLSAMTITRRNVRADESDVMIKKVCLYPRQKSNQRCKCKVKKGHDGNEEGR